MNLHQQIKKYRMAANYSQEELADHLYVSRQTISNWETGKNYPDIHSLLLMSSLFHVTLDELVKGDLEIMKETIQKENVQKFTRLAAVFTALFIIFIISAAPLFYYLKEIGIIIFLCFAAVLLVIAIQVEKMKKDYDTQTYKEIVAFMNGERLDEMQKREEYGKRPYQKYSLAILFGIITFIITMLLLYIFSQIS